MKNEKYIKCRIKTTKKMSKRLYTAGKGKRGMECIDLSILKEFKGILANC